LTAADIRRAGEGVSFVEFNSTLKTSVLTSSRAPKKMDRINVINITKPLDDPVSGMA
jgi:hypothetical protein